MKAKEFLTDAFETFQQHGLPLGKDVTPLFIDHLAKLMEAYHKHRIESIDLENEVVFIWSENTQQANDASHIAKQSIKWFKQQLLK